MNRTTVAGLTLALLLAAVVPQLAAEDKAAPITVTGLLEQQDIDDPASPLVITDQETEQTYIIVMNKVGKELKKLVGEIMKLTGVAGADGEGRATLTVQKHEKLQLPEADDGDDEDWQDDGADWDGGE